MGSDFYCALCGGPLGSFLVHYASRHPKALENGRKEIAEQRRKQQKDQSNAGNDDAGEDEKEKPEAADGMEDDEQTTEQHRSMKRTESVCSDNAESDSDVDNDDEVSSSLSEGESDWSAASFEECETYDPEKLQEGKVKWLDHCRALSFNPSAHGITKAYISGRAAYDGYDGFRVKRLGRDPNDSDERDMTCFRAFHRDETASFPFHEACYKILARSLGHNRYQAIDKDVLYSIMTALADDRALKLPYAIDGQQQYWTCIPGEEFSVCNPSFQPTLEDILPGMLPESVFRKSEITMHCREVGHNPFCALPSKVLLKILVFLETGDMLSFTRASAKATSHAQLWKEMIHMRILPWFWELAAVLENRTCPDILDYRSLFMWSHGATNPRYGLEGPLMGIANRRRIWNACQPIRLAYRQRNDQVSIERHLEMEAKALLGSAKAFHVPPVCYPFPYGTKSVSTQFVRSWDETIDRSCKFNTYWGDDGEGALMGVAVTIGASQRVFGTTCGKPGLPLQFTANEWIQEIRVSVTACDMFEANLNRTHRQAVDIGSRNAGQCFIGGMEIILTTGRSEVVKSGGPNSRPFIILPGMYLIGVTGTIAPNGVICSLGLLQSRRPELTSSAPAPAYTRAQSILWGPSALQVYNGPGSHCRSPIWHNSFYNLQAFTCGGDDEGGALPSAITPHHLFLWSDTASELRFLRRLSTFSIVVGFCNGPVRELLGFASYHNGSLLPTRRVGTFGPVASQIPHWDTEGYSSEHMDGGDKPPTSLRLHLSMHHHPFDTKHMSHFDVNGAGGEEVNEVHVRTDFKAMILKTNWGRECQWGEDGSGGEWLSRKASKDECIVGLNVCFGNLGGWSVKARMHSHWKLSKLEVVLAPRDIEVEQ